MANDPTARRFLNVGHLLVHLFMLIFPTAVLTLGPELGRPYEELLPLAAVGFVALGLATLPAGWLGDRWSRTGMMTVFFIGIGGASILTGFAQSAFQIACGLGLIGAFAAIYHPVGLSLVVASGGRVGAALAVNGVFGNFGVALAAVVTGALSDFVGWRAAFIVPGALSILLGLAYAAVVRTPAPAPARHVVDPAAAATPAATQARVFAMVLISAVLGGIMFNAITVSLPKVFEVRAAGIVTGTFAVGGLVSVVFAVAAFAQLPVGRLLDRFGARWLEAILAAAQAGLLVLAVRATNYEMVMVATPLLLAVFGAIPVGDWLIAHYTGERWRSRIYAVNYVLVLGVGALSVPLVAWLYGRTGGFAAVFALLAASTAIIAVSALLLLPSGRPALRPAPFQPD